MVLFPIQFSFAGINYKATVHKVPGNPVQYLVSEFEPKNSVILNPYVFVWNKKEGELQFSVNPDMPMLGGTIAYKIFKECKERNIPID